MATLAKGFTVAFRIVAAAVPEQMAMVSDGRRSAAAFAAPVSTG
jgi:hypothetical protein